MTHRSGESLLSPREGWGVRVAAAAVPVAWMLEAIFQRAVCATSESDAGWGWLEALPLRTPRDTHGSIPRS